jgi:hypothetical protein
MNPLKFLKEDSENLILGYDNNIPIIACWQISYLQIAFYCPYCKSVHRHGIGNGHRAAHCNNPESPFIKTGYNLCCQGIQEKNK